MNGQPDSFLPSAIVLGTIAGIAIYLTIARPLVDVSRPRLRSAAALALLVVVFQAAHFSEELVTGFHERFPAVFGLAPMSQPLFVSFNVAWLAIWSLSAWGITTKRRAFLFPLWFLAMGCLLNGVAHPLLAARAGGYFPGLVTSPLAGILGLGLFRRLRSITRGAD